MPEFIPGLKLGELFYDEAVEPVMKAEFPDVPYSAALIGSGSEILGFDTPMSSDHHWGPRSMLFLTEADYAQHRDAIHDVFRHRLPYTFHGYSTHFTPPDPNDNHVQLLETLESGLVNHRVEIMTINGFFRDYLGVDPMVELDVADWLTIPQQKLRTVTGGAVYHDELGLKDVRGKFAYYPRDVWFYLLATAWSRIGQEEPFVGRTGDVGDELGSAVIAARLVQHLMRLCFLIERQYAPYSKWFGTAFSRLDCAAALTPLLASAIAGKNWRERESYLSQAYEIVAAMHNTLGISDPLPAKVSPFFTRPFQVIQGGAFADAVRARIEDAAVKRIDSLIGGIDTFSDSTDLTEATHLRARLKGLYP